MQADLDNGYTRIANEILEALARLDLSGREFRVAITVMRKTYGFQKKIDWIGREQISAITEISSENVSRMVTMLVAKKVLLQEGSGNVKKLGINTNIREWNRVENDTIDVSKRHDLKPTIVSETTAALVESDTPRVENDTVSCRIRQTQKKKETITKETITKDIYAPFDFSTWPEKPSEQIWVDWKSHRKGKRAAINQTVINRMGGELTKAFAMGYSVDHCLSEQQEAGWQGFKLEWMLGRNNSRGPPGKSSETIPEFQQRVSDKGRRVAEALRNQIND